jgi:uncharacterized membrane protein YtjA (UPF0391 family)
MLLVALPAIMDTKLLYDQSLIQYAITLFMIKNQGGYMLDWVLTFLILAIVAAVFGFTGIAVASAEIARVIFYIFIILFIVSLILHLVDRDI